MLLVLGVISSKMSLRNWSGVPLVIVVIIDTIELMHSWGFALREGVFAETKEGKFKNKREKS